MTTIPPNKKVDRALQDALDYACARGRELARIEPLRAASAKRAEKIMAVLYRGQNVSPSESNRMEAKASFNKLNGEDSIAKQVYEFHNGHPVGSEELHNFFPDNDPHVLNTIRGKLCRRKLLTRVYRGVYKRIAVLLLLTGGLTTFAQIAPMPNPPKQQIVAMATNSVTLAWDSSPDPQVVGYRIYWGIAGGALTNSVTVGTNRVATLVGLVWRAQYRFAAVAYDSTGLESVFSNIVLWTAPDPPVPTLSIRPAMFEITWSALAGVPYTLQWSTNLTSTNWFNYSTFLSGTNANAKVLVTNDSPRKIWRVKL